jgi:hypothetical protein
MRELGGYGGWRVSEVKLGDVPKPFLNLVLRGSRTFPVSRTPHLLASPDSPSFDLLGSGE